jgi:hypothetical protein
MNKTRAAAAVMAAATVCLTAFDAPAAPPPPGSEQWADLSRYAAAINAMRQPDHPDQDCCGIERDCRRTRLMLIDGRWMFLAARSAWPWGDDRWHPVPDGKSQDYDNGVPFVVVCASPGRIGSGGDPFVFCVHPSVR